MTDPDGRGTRVLSIRAPDHLGDGIMALPAVEALAAAFPAQVHAPRWGPEIYAGIPVLPAEAPPAGDTAVLLKPSLGAAWRWRRVPRRVGIGPAWLLTDALPARTEHRRDGYARVASALGVAVTGLPAYRPRGAAPALPEGFVGLNPWSATPTVRWPHFRALADALPGPVVFFAGPGEGDVVRAVAGPHRVLEGLAFPDLAAALDLCRVFVSGDSGAAHFAAACGVRTLVLHGPTAAAVTGAGEGLEAAGPWCRPCYRGSCPFGAPCLASIPVADVLRAVG